MIRGLILVIFAFLAVWTEIFGAENSTLQVPQPPFEPRFESEADNTLTVQGFISENQGNLIRAKSLYKVGCENKEAWGCYNMGAIEEKLGNLKQAKDWYQKSCNTGDPSGCYALGTLAYRKGEIDRASDFFALFACFVV